MRPERRRGACLAELLVGLFLTVLLLQALVPLLSNAFLSWKVGVARTVTNQSARLAVESMTRELRLASNIDRPLPGESGAAIQFDTPDKGNLVFQRGTSSGQNPLTVYRVPGTGQPNPLTQNNATTLQFEWRPPRLVLISLVLTDAETGVAVTTETAVICDNIPDEGE